MLVPSILASCLLGPPALPADDGARPTEGPAWSPTWIGPRACDGTAALRDRIAVLVPDLPARAVEVTVELVQLGPQQLAVTVEIASPIGNERRSFVSPDCATVVEAAALIVAVIVDPLAASEALTSTSTPGPTPPVEALPGRAPASEPGPEPGPEPAVVIEAAPPSPALEGRPDTSEAELGLDLSVGPERRRDPIAPVQLALELVGGGGYGPLTGGSLEWGGGVAIVGQAFRVGARVAWLPGLVHRLSDARRVVFSSWHVGARACGVPRLGSRRRWELPACAGVEAGQVRATPLAPIANRRPGVRPWLAIEARTPCRTCS